MIVDAHQHFWDPARGDYGWLKPDNPIHRVFATADLRPADPTRWTPDPV